MLLYFIFLHIVTENAPHETVTKHKQFSCFFVSYKLLLNNYFVIS